MRLTARQQQIIREAARDVFGSETRVWLFGSRVDDSRRGGDIDLYIEAPIDDPERLSTLENRFYARLQRLLGEQRVDIISHSPGTPPSAIQRQARRQGIPL